MADSDPEFDRGLVDLTRTSLTGLAHLDEETVREALARLLPPCGDGRDRLWGEGPGHVPPPQGGT
jgi:FXSXX-COOH protein